MLGGRLIYATALRGSFQRQGAGITRRGDARIAPRFQRPFFFKKKQKTKNPLMNWTRIWPP